MRQLVFLCDRIRTRLRSNRAAPPLDVLPIINPTGNLPFAGCAAHIDTGTHANYSRVGYSERIQRLFRLGDRLPATASRQCGVAIPAGASPGPAHGCRCVGHLPHVQADYPSHTALLCNMQAWLRRRGAI